IHRPPLLLLDEPETGLDQDAMAALESLLAQHREGGGSAIVTTHGVEQGLRVGDRAAILHGGRVVYDGPADASEADTFRRIYAEHTGGEL
ncbi:MAG: sodium ABC transporter ATP-binding protein, partial [Chloroflexota bacterium]|nr:sodium ABC transporter ATP-binding protein [Chloroflexota bacterium]